MVRAFFVVSILFLGLFSLQPASAETQGRKSIVVASPIVDDQARAALPTSFSADTLRRELETALEATNLFSVPIRDQREIKLILDEMVASKRRAPGVRKADFILIPTVESVTLSVRRRVAPNYSSRDLVSATGAMALRVEIFSPDNGGSTRRMEVRVKFQGAEHLEDPVGDGDLGRFNAKSSQGSTSEFVELSQAVGKAFAKRVLDQVYPAIVVQAASGRVFISRGEDAGYHIGEILRVLRRGAPIINPVTKEVLDYADDEIAVVKVSEVRPRVSIAEVVSAKTEIVVGDIVREPVEE